MLEILTNFSQPEQGAEPMTRQEKATFRTVAEENDITRTLGAMTVNAVVKMAEDFIGQHEEHEQKFLRKNFTTFEVARLAMKCKRAGHDRSPVRLYKRY